MADKITVEVVFGLPERQYLRRFQVDEGCTARAAVFQAALPPEIAARLPETLTLGIFGKKTAEDTILQDGDRVEIYRDLILDPKEARRRKVLKKNE